MFLRLYLKCYYCAVTWRGINTEVLFLTLVIGIFTCSPLLKVLLLRSNMEREMCEGYGSGSVPRDVYMLVFT